MGVMAEKNGPAAARERELREATAVVAELRRRIRELVEIVHPGAVDCTAVVTLDGHPEPAVLHVFWGGPG